ncbi:MAG: hypothetical protein IPK97_10100 [Ahniella sp.]|nr:hypothetical protein [Ahniella sp.]
MNRLPADAFAVAAPPSRETAPIVTALKTSSIWRHVVMNPLCALAFLFGFAPASQAAVSALGAPAQVAANTSLAFTVPAGTNRLLVVTASNASSTAVPTVSFGVTPMTLVVQRDDTFATDSIWRLALGTSVTPTTATITVSGFTTAANTVVTAQTFDGVDQTTPIDGTGTQQISSGSDIASSITLNTTTAGDLVFDIFDSFRNSGPITATPNAPQTGIHDVSLTIAAPGTGIGRYRTSSKTGVAGSTTVGWTSDSVAILHLAANINAAAVLPNPNLSINDVAINEGNAGSTAFSFNVNLSAPAGPGGVVFDIGTANNTATAGVDYVANALTAQTIPAGSNTYAFTVQVNGDTTFEPNETFFVNVTNVVGATVVDGQGMGTITNDDADPCAPFIPVHHVRQRRRN